MFPVKPAQLPLAAAYLRKEQKRKMAKYQNEETITFNVRDVREKEMHAILRSVYDALVEKGYNPINQIVGYILSEDPTYITNHNNARALIRKIDRDELLNALVRCYLNV